MPRATTDFATVVLWVILACLAHVAADVLVLLYRRRSRISRGRADAALDYADMAIPVSPAVPVPYPGRIGSLRSWAAPCMPAVGYSLYLTRTTRALTETLTLTLAPPFACMWVPGRRRLAPPPPSPFRAPPPTDPPDSRGGVGLADPTCYLSPSPSPLVP